MKARSSLELKPEFASLREKQPKAKSKLFESYGLGLRLERTICYDRWKF
jgi:hypothetical protein